MNKFDFPRVRPGLLLAVATSLLGCSNQDESSSTPGSGSSTGGSASGGSANGGTGGASQGGSAAGGGAADGGASTFADAPASRVSYQLDDSSFLNPERGFYTTTELTSADDLTYVRDEGKSLVYASVHLDEYLGANHEQDLPEQLLADVQAGFDAVRAAKLKAVVRFQYDDGEGYPGGANDASLAFITRHIEQLAPVLEANADVLFLLQAGFIGAWGEWHTSNNFSDGTGDAAAREAVVDALLAALPKSRRTAVRYPAYKRMFFGTSATSAADLQSDSDRARVGHVNDCFVSGDEDVGTYQYEPVATLRDYLAEDTRFVPIGGETCALHARNSCTTTLSEMERFHWTYINDDYHPGVLAVWDSEGCRPEIERRLGYRLALQSASVAPAVRPGGSFKLGLEVENVGFAALSNRRPVLVVLEGEGVRLTAELDVDPRTWLPGVTDVEARLRLPIDLVPGSYRLALWLPDDAEGLRSQPEYSVRLSNTDVWNEAAGDNTLAEVQVAEDAPGDVDPSATSFGVIP